MYKKLAVFFLCTLFGSNLINISASEVYVSKEPNKLEERLDYDEEIEMFDNFYQHPNDYIFQDINGEELNEYILTNQGAFYEDEYAVTAEMMNKVRSVQELDKSISPFASNKKTWTDQKVYYTNIDYCMFNLTATYNVTSGKITSGSAVAQRTGLLSANSYSIQSSTSNIGNGGTKITFVVSHLINRTNLIKTSHSISI